GDRLGGRAIFLGAVDQVAVGIALTLATVAAATLTARTATRAFAFVAVLLLVIPQLFLVWQRFVLQRFCLFGTRLAFLTRWALALRTLATGLTLGALFTLFVRAVQRLAQFTHALFARGTLFSGRGLGAVVLTFARCALFTWRPLFARLAFLTGLTLLARRTRLALLTWGALFTRLAFLVPATAVTALLTTVTTLFTWRTL